MVRVYKSTVPSFRPTANACGWMGWSVIPVGTEFPDPMVSRMVPAGVGSAVAFFGVVVVLLLVVADGLAMGIPVERRTMDPSRQPTNMRTTPTPSRSYPIIWGGNKTIVVPAAFSK